MTKPQAEARYIAEQALQAQLAGDAISAKYLIGQAEAIDPVEAAAVLTRVGVIDGVPGDLANRMG